MRAALVLCLLAACGSRPLAVIAPTPPVPDPTTALAALRDARFADARRAATEGLGRAPHDARLAAIRALSTYAEAGDRLALDVMTVLERADARHAFDDAAGRQLWTRFLAELDAVDRDLATAEADPQLSLELCLACWPAHDWNHDGHIDDRDRALFELEVDAAGHSLPDGDPRRRPTFRFDAGDILWARAMVAFQRAGVELVLAYRWSELDAVFKDRWSDGQGERLVIHLVEPERVVRARADLAAGLGFSAREREAYLAETDDDREWVPSPRQHSAIPLPIDATVYARWAELLGDGQRLLASEDGISMREVVALFDGRAALLVPDAYVDVGRLLREPTDLAFDLRDVKPTPASIEHIARGVLGHGYVARMRPSPLVGRLRHMRAELEAGGDTFAHKLRLLMWLN